VTRVSDGVLIWDSGKIASSSQSFVPYSGPALTAGTSYTWTVRTWDRGGLASPWAATASFDTGISDADWKASWIRRTTTETDDYTLARREVTIGAQSGHQGSCLRVRVSPVRAAIEWDCCDRGPAFSYPGKVTTKPLTSPAK